MNAKQSVYLQSKTLEKEIRTESLAENCIKINGKVYKIVPLPAITRGLPLWESNIKKLIPSVGSLLDRFQHDEFSGSPTTFTEAMINLANNLDGTTLMNLSLELFDGATVDGELFDPDVEFAGNYGAWRQLLLFALTENYSSFFPEGWAAKIVSMVTEMLNMGQMESEESGDLEPQE